MEHCSVNNIHTYCKCGPTCFHTSAMVESPFKSLYPATLDLAKRPHALISNKSIHPLSGSQTKLRFLALPGSNIRPWLPLGANLRSDLPSRGGELARWVLRLNNRAAFLKHLVVHHQPMQEIGAYSSLEAIIHAVP